MPNVQRRLPGEQWSAFSTKRASAFGGQQQQQAPTGTPLRTAAQVAQERTAGIKPGGPFTPPPRPSQPQPAQPQPPMFGGATVGPSFATKGVGKYFNRNANGNQFNKPAIRSAVDNITKATANAQYFQHAGFGAALRHSFGLQQIPSHVNDFLNANHNTSVRGRDPDPISAQLGDVS